MLDTVSMNRQPRSSISRSVWPLPHQCNLNPSVLGHGVSSADRMAVDVGYNSTTLRRNPFVPVFAVQDGVVAHIEKTGGGHAITIDHGSWFTHYSDLEQVSVTKRAQSTRRRERVRAGDILGYVRWPAHVRFELWQFDDDGELVPVDPEPHLRQWLLLPDLEQPLNSDAVAA